MPEDGLSALLVSPRHLDAGLGLQTVPPFSLVQCFPHHWTRVGLFGKHPVEAGTLLRVTRQGFPMSCREADSSSEWQLPASPPNVTVFPFPSFIHWKPVTNSSPHSQDGLHAAPWEGPHVREPVDTGRQVSTCGVTHSSGGSFWDHGGRSPFCIRAVPEPAGVPRTSSRIACGSPM